MKFTSYLTDLSCSSCGKSFPSEQIQTFCPDCKAPLLVNYDLQAVKVKVDRDQFTRRTKNMWRWFELLPVREMDNIISLGEGDSPLLRLDHLGAELGISHLFLQG